MTEVRVPRAATAAKRQKLLDAAEQVMVKEGYAAVTSRRVEAEAGLKVHYHFGTLDDLLVAVVRRRGEEATVELTRALTTDEPLRSWWQVASDRRGNTLLVELTAAANHRPAVQAELAAFARTTRRMQIEALGSILDEYGIDREVFPPALVAATLQGLAFAMAHDQVAGFDTAQDEATAAVEQLLDRLEAQRRARSA
ncbi:MAG: TetR family transcriptional regulator [Acidimicrobiia bacterium]